MLSMFVLLFPPHPCVLFPTSLCGVQILCSLSASSSSSRRPPSSSLTSQPSLSTSLYHTPLDAHVAAGPVWIVSEPVPEQVKTILNRGHAFHGGLGPHGGRSEPWRKICLSLKSGFAKPIHGGFWGLFGVLDEGHSWPWSCKGYSV